MMMGLMTGFTVSYLLHVANKSQGAKGYTSLDFRGADARVVIPFSGSDMGKIKLVAKGRIMEIEAVLFDDSDDNVVFDFQDECVVLDVEDGVARVVPKSALERSKS